jgi:RND superfamily putative drug exporter
LATLLYKLGLYSARNAWQVIVAWIILLAITTGLALSLGGKLTTTMSVSGVPSQNVVDQLQKTFPDASRGSGQVVFFKQSGSFTDADREAITAALSKLETLPEISEAVNPFTVQSEIRDGEKEIIDGKQAEMEALTLLWYLLTPLRFYLNPPEFSPVFAVLP